MSRGHNIIADGWAGASNPHPHPNTQTYTKSIANARFPTFQLDHHGPTDGLMQWINKASYTVACPQLKIEQLMNDLQI